MTKYNKETRIDAVMAIDGGESVRGAARRYCVGHNRFLKRKKSQNIKNTHNKSIIQIHNKFLEKGLNFVIRSIKMKKRFTNKGKGETKCQM